MTDPVASAHEGYEWRCYRHPEREAGVKCRRCERAICPECMISAPVGFQCRECVKGAPPVRTLRSLRSDPYVTLVLVALNVAVFLPVLVGRAESEAIGLYGPYVARGDWWRVVTSGFLHFDLLHITFNMLILWRVGQLLEPIVGRLRFGLLYAVSLLAGSLGVLLLEPRDLAGGASGAVFGMMAAAVVVMRAKGIDPRRAGFGTLLVVNLVLTFVVPGIAIGAHLGGLVGGGAAGALVVATGDGPGGRAAGSAACAVLAVVIFLVSLGVAGRLV